MYLHLGSDKIVPLSSVIAISDFKISKSAPNKEFLQTMTDKQMVIDISEGNPKSFVLVDNKVYLSAISSATLKKRASAGYWG